MTAEQELSKLLISFRYAGHAIRLTAKNTVISPGNFKLWKFCGKAQIPHSFGRIAKNYAESVPFRKIYTQGIQVKLQYFSQRSYFYHDDIFISKMYRYSKNFDFQLNL